MRRLTTRNPDNSISIERVPGKELLEHLAECEDKLERMEKVLEALTTHRNKAFYKNDDRYYSGKYSAFHRAIESIKMALEVKRNG